VKFRSKTCFIRYVIYALPTNRFREMGRIVISASEYYIRDVTDVILYFLLKNFHCHKIVAITSTNVIKKIARLALYFSQKNRICFYSFITHMETQ